MEYIDVHAHLDDEVFAEENVLDELVERARSAGCRGIICVSMDSSQSASKVLSIARRYADLVRASIGIHPQRVIDIISNQLERVGETNFEQICDRCRNAVIEELSQLDRVMQDNINEIVTIGECGLDYTPHLLCQTTKHLHDESKRNDLLKLIKELQVMAFEKQAELALSYDVPMNVHSRSAGKPMVDVLSRFPGLKAILHAFDGRPAIAVRAWEYGYRISIPVTLIRDDHMCKLVQRLPLEALLLESDSPSLAPVKGANQRNEPCNVILTINKIAHIKRVSPEFVAQTILATTLTYVCRLNKKTS